MPYHAEHHSYPAVPFHKLPDLHRLTAEHLKVTEKGYSGFHARYAPAMNGGVEAAK
jgi:fatty acid desaturase